MRLIFLTRVANARVIPGETSARTHDVRTEGKAQCGIRDRTYVRERRKAPGKVYTYARGRKHKEVTPASHIRTDDLVSTAPTVRPLRHDAGVGPKN